MRRQIVHEGAEQLSYEIREIVTVAHEFEKLGVENHLGEYRRSHSKRGKGAGLDQGDRRRLGHARRLLCLLSHAGYS